MANKPHTQWHTNDLHQTPASIAAARRAQLIERLEFEAKTGIRVGDDGRLGKLLGLGIIAAVSGSVRGSHRG